MRLIKKLYAAVRNLVLSYGRHDGALMAAAISFYGLLAIFPLLLATVAVLSAVFPAAGVQSEVTSRLDLYAPGTGALVGGALTEALRARPQVGAVAVVTLLWSASGVFTVMSRALSRIFPVKRHRPFIASRLLALAMAAAGLAFFAMPYILTVAVHVGTRMEVNILGLKDLGAAPRWRSAAAVGPFLISFVVLTLVYWRLPDHRVPRRVRHVLPGSLAAAAAFDVARRFFMWYIPNLAGYHLVYGSLTAVVVLLLWLYLGSTILLLGAEVAAAHPWGGTADEGDARRKIAA
jgi:membrane protein